MSIELTSTEEPRTARKVARWTRIGATYGALLGGIVAIARTVSEAPPQPYHVSTSVLVGVYMFGGAAGGAIFGTLEHLMRSLAGAAVVGLLVFLPIGLAVSVTHFPRESLTSIVLTTVLGSLVLGPPNFILYVMMRRFFIGSRGPHPRNRGSRRNGSGGPD
jgi:hypothetical protein